MDEDGVEGVDSESIDESKDGGNKEDMFEAQVGDNSEDDSSDASTEGTTATQIIKKYPTDSDAEDA